MEHHHSKEENKLACDALKKIAKTRSDQSYSMVKKQFIKAQSLAITEEFWQIIHRHPKGRHYKRVSHCPGCKKFGFE